MPYCFPVAAATNYNKLVGLKQKFMLSVLVARRPASIAHTPLQDSRGAYIPYLFQVWLLQVFIGLWSPHSNLSFHCCIAGSSSVHKKKKIILTKKNCFVVLCWSLPNLNMSQPCIPVFPPSWISLPLPSPSHPSRLLQSPSLSSLSHKAKSHCLSILHMVIHVSMLLSP